MIEISNFLYNLARGLASHLLSDPETRRNLFPPLPPLNNVFFISFFFLVAFLFIVQYFVRQFSHCAINSFCPNCCVVLVTWVIKPCYYVLEFKFKNNAVHMYLSQSNCLVSAWILSWFMFKICLECSQLSEHCINLYLSFTRHDMQYCGRLSSLVKSDISLQFSLFSSLVMTDVFLSQNMLPVYLVLCQRKNTKMLLRLVLFNIMLFWAIVLLAFTCFLSFHV